MPKGGQRPGSGRKPSKPRTAVVLKMPVFGPAPVVPVEAERLIEPPAGLTEAQREKWKALAPHAIVQGTLTDATRAGFAELCEQLVMKEQIAAAINIAGAAHEGMARLLRQYVPLAQRLDQSLGRFRLTGSGKAEVPVQRQVVANPWASVAGKGGV